MKEFEVVDKIEDADKVVLWTDVVSLAQGIVRLAHAYKKPVIVVQHGRHGSSRYYPPFNEPILADRICVWGERDKKVLIENGHPEKKIFITGTTIFQYLKPRKPHEGINIVFYPEHWDREVSENRKVKNELRKIKGVKIITKLIEGQEPKDYDNPVISNRNNPDHLDICVEVLSTADLVVGIEEGTFGLLAQAMDIPVVIMEEWYPKTFGGDERYYNYWRRISEGSKRTTLGNLNETIKQQLENPDELKKERRIACVQEGGIEIENPLERIKQVIENA